MEENGKKWKKSVVDVQIEGVLIWIIQEYEY